MRRFLLASAFAIAFVPVLTYAQHGSGVAGGHAAAAPAPHVVMHAPSAAAPHASAAPHSSSGHYVRTRSGAIVYRPATHSISAANRPPDSRRVLSQDEVPGLGFDYPHLAAIGNGRGNGRGFGRNRNFPNFAYFPFFGGGYYLPLYDDYDDTPTGEEQQAQAVEPDYFPGSYPAPPRPGDTPQGFPAPAPVASAAATPERPSEEYVFVRRDGSLFFAVAYTWDAGNLRYVTSEGLRRSVSGESLDLDATQQFNEQRGLSFRVPSA